MILFGYTIIRVFFEVAGESRYEPWGSSIWGGGVRFSSWYVISVDTGHMAQTPQSGPRWTPAFKAEPVLSVSSFIIITSSFLTLTLLPPCYKANLHNPGQSSSEDAKLHHIHKVLFSMEGKVLTGFTG